MNVEDFSKVIFKIVFIFNLLKIIKNNLIKNDIF